LAVNDISTLLNAVCGVSAALIMVHFLTTYNLKIFHDWRADADAPLMILDASKTQINKHEKTIQAIASLELEFPLKFYLEKKPELKKVLFIHRTGQRSIQSDIYFLDRSDSGISDTLELKNEWIKMKYPQGGTMFYRKLNVQ
jgi:hypothetical protein